MKRSLKLAEVCKQLDLPPYVLRYWETEFPALQAGGAKGSGAARTFSSDDVAVLRRIKQLLYEEGYTIAGARKKLESDPLPSPADAPTGPLFAPAHGAADGTVAGGETAASAGKPAVAPELDSRGDERIETLRRGVAEALKEARAILSLLEKSSR